MKRKPGKPRSIRVDEATGCLVPMSRARCKTGYPQYKYEGRRCQAARVVWIEAHGPIEPPELQVDHLCRNRECVNVEHLELVTAAGNSRRRHSTKLNVEKAAAIRASSARGRDLAREYGVSEATISLLRHGKTWVGA